MHRSNPKREITDFHAAAAMNAIRYCLLTLALFPSVTFGILTAEIFPWAVLFALVSPRKIESKDALLTVFLLLILSLSAAWSFAAYRESDAVRSLGAYLNAIAAFVAFLFMSPAWVNRSIKLARKVFIFLLILGLAQYTELLQSLDDLLSLLVPRATGGNLAEMGGRGVTLLSSEPSRAGTELVFFYLLFRLTHPSKKSFILTDIALIGYLLLIIKAAQPLALGMFAIGLFVTRSPMQVMFLILAIMITPFASMDIGGSRVLSLIGHLFSQQSFSAALSFLMNESGHRLLTIYAFFLSGMVNPLGMGVGNWPIASIQAIKETGFDTTQLRYFMLYGNGDAISVRGSGVLPNMMLDIGILGTSFFLYWIFAISKRFRLRSRVTFLIMLILLVKISFFGSVGEPLPWIVTALILRHNANRGVGPSAQPKQLPPPSRGLTGPGLGGRELARVGRRRAPDQAS